MAWMTAASQEEWGSCAIPLAVLLAHLSSRGGEHPSSSFDTLQAAFMDWPVPDEMYLVI